MSTPATDPNTAPVPGAPSASAATSGTSAGTDAILQAITDLTSSLQDTQVKLDSLTENVQKVSAAVAEQANFQTTAQGVTDPYENVRRDRAQYDTLMQRMQSGADALMAIVLENFNLAQKQHLRIVDLAASGHWGVPSAGAAPTPTAGTKTT